MRLRLIFRLRRPPCLLNDGTAISICSPSLAEEPVMAIGAPTRIGSLGNCFQVSADTQNEQQAEDEQLSQSSRFPRDRA